jgi:hypothetical protein
MDNDNIRFIELTNSTCFASVDAEDYERVKALDTSWYLMDTGHSKTVRSCKWINGKYAQLSRFILNLHTTDYPLVDHKNRDPLNNRKENLRKATYSENLYNSKTRKDNTSGTKGVSFMKANNNWSVNIFFRKRRYYKGGFKTKEEAIAHRNRVASNLHKEFATF